MKHSAKVLAIFLSLFILSQVFGIYLLSLSVQEIKTTPEGTEVIYENTSMGERPEVEGYSSLIYIGAGVLIGTLLLLLLAKFNKVKIWKVWYLLAAWMTISISLGVFFNEDLYIFAWILAAALALAKIYYPHPIIHNITELLMYAGIALLLAPIFTVPIAIILLVCVSIYDAYAVWKSKHMITLAEFTKRSSLFPGLALTYSEKNHKTKIHSEQIKTESSDANAKSEKEHKRKSSARTGVLGGGDAIFPLIFTGAVFTKLISTGHSTASALALCIIVSLGAALSLALLFIYGKKERYYPAMPFLTAGCLAGYAVMLIFA